MFVVWVWIVWVVASRAGRVCRVRVRVRACFVTLTGRVCRVRAMILSRLRVGYVACVR